MNHQAEGGGGGGGGGLSMRNPSMTPRISDSKMTESTSQLALIRERTVPEARQHAAAEVVLSCTKHCHSHLERD